MENAAKKKELPVDWSLRYLNSQSISILENVIQHCRCENDDVKTTGTTTKQSRQFSHPSKITGVTQKLIENVQKLDEQLWTCPKPTLSLQLSIRQILLGLYSSTKKEPTCKDIYDILRLRTNDLPIFKKFRIQMADSGYETVEVVNGGQMIIENSKITFERYLYLKKITDARAMNNKINYMSARIYDIDQKRMVPITSAYLNQLTPTSVTLILYLVISKDGCQNAFFSYSFDRDTIIEWVSRILLPKLQQSGEKSRELSSVIVIENNPIFESPEEHISKYESKKNMIKWLENHYLPYNQSMHKAELYALIDKYSVKLNKNLENVLQSFGHSVIHVPEQINGLTPTELFWKDINDELKSINECDIMVVKDRITHFLDLLQKWKAYDQEIQKMEEMFLAIETELENCLDKYELNLDSIVCEGDKNWHHITLV